MPQNGNMPKGNVAGPCVLAGAKLGAANGLNARRAAFGVIAGLEMPSVGLARAATGFTAYT
jgi:hypothetical protein